MDKFELGTIPKQTIKGVRRKLGCSKVEAKVIIESMKGAQVWINDTYQVEIRPHNPNPDWPPMLWLSIKRRDKEAIHDWRELQEIKNQLVGPECEGLELYPAEARLIDGSNQFHLWVCSDPNVRFPFGMTTDGKGPSRATPEEAAKAGAKQRPFKKGG